MPLKKIVSDAWTFTIHDFPQDEDPLPWLSYTYLSWNITSQGFVSAQVVFHKRREHPIRYLQKFRVFWVATTVERIIASPLPDAKCKGSLPKARYIEAELVPIITIRKRKLLEPRYQSRKRSRSPKRTDYTYTVINYNIHTSQTTTIASGQCDLGKERSYLAKLLGLPDGCPMPGIIPTGSVNGTIRSCNDQSELLGLANES